MKSLKNIQGVTMIELLIVTMVLAIIATISFVMVSNVIEKTRLDADYATVINLNASTRLYHTQSTTDEMFLDTSVSSEDLLTYLYEQGYINTIPVPQSKDAEFIWHYPTKLWTLVVDDSQLFIATDEKHFTAHASFTYRITSYDLVGGTSIVIPKTINDVTITAITGLNDLGLTSVVIKGSLTHILNQAFRNNNITSVTFNEGVEVIGILAFDNNNITEVILPNSITIVGASAFHNNAITRIVIGDGVSIGDSYSFGTNRPGGSSNFHEVYASPTGGAGTYVFDGVNRVKE